VHLRSVDRNAYGFDSSHPVPTRLFSGFRTALSLRRTLHDFNPWIVAAAGRIDAGVRKACRQLEAKATPARSP